MIGILSICACAMSIRSNGFLWGHDNLTFRAARLPFA